MYFCELSNKLKEKGIRELQKETVGGAGQKCDNLILLNIESNNEYHELQKKVTTKSDRVRVITMYVEMCRKLGTRRR